MGNLGDEIAWTLIKYGILIGLIATVVLGAIGFGAYVIYQHL